MVGWLRGTQGPCAGWGAGTVQWGPAQRTTEGHLFRSTEEGGDRHLPCSAAWCVAHTACRQAASGPLLLRRWTALIYVMLPSEEVQLRCDNPTLNPPG